MFVDIGTSSIRGHRGELQDAYLATPIAVGVFDGHDRKGYEIATGSADMLTEELERKGYLPPERVRYAFASLENRYRGWRGGTTATLVQHAACEDGTYTVDTAWVGDSPAYLISAGRVNPEGEVAKLVREHNTSNPAEVARLQSLGIEAVAGYFNITDHAMLAVSRAIGDTTGTSAIIAEPEITHVQAGPGDLLVVASDGVINAETEVDVVYEIADLYLAGAGLREIAGRMTAQYAEITRDNATLVLAKIGGR